MFDEREIRQPVDLCTPRGRLNPAAVGWSRQPLHRTDLRGWSRTKRWEYWGIVTPENIIGLTVSSLDYAGVHGIYLLDRRTGVETVRDAVEPLARSARFLGRPGLAQAKAGGLELAFTGEGEATRIRASALDIEVDVIVPDVVDHESLAVVVPWSRRLFQYTIKDVARPASGTVTLNGQVRRFTTTDSFAVLDHGRGRWPYSMTWNWGAGYGVIDGRALGLQIGGKWTDATGSTENALFVDGRLDKISEDLKWEYDKSDWMRPWTIHGSRMHVTLTPFHERVARTNLAVVASQIHQCFGEFSGWVRSAQGERIALDGLTGWVEEARNRW